MKLFRWIFGAWVLLGLGLAAASGALAQEEEVCFDSGELL